jgi:FtsZ-interacting cell division protein YlmF
MSEYQYYEFQAVDKPLTETQMAKLRRLSTRAQITPTSFINSYSWGDFKGKPRVLMEKYFDAFVYLANWGTRWFMLRLPRRLLSPEVVAQYCKDERASFRVAGDHIILDFQSENEEGEWVEDDGWLSSLIHTRAEMVRGDLRCLYLAWLLSAQEGELDDEEREPPVPPNLQHLSAGLRSFAEFLRIDDDLIAVAAEASPDQNRDSASRADLEAWIGRLSAKEKDGLLLRVIDGDNPHLGAELRQRFECERCPTHEEREEDRRRTVGELLRDAEEHAEKRRRQEAERKAREEAKRERARVAARKKHIESLAGKATTLWGKVDSLIATKQPKRYDEAVTLLEDLRDLSKIEQTSGEFSSKMNALLSEHSRKPSLVSRFREASLLGLVDQE